MKPLAPLVARFAPSVARMFLLAVAVLLHGAGVRGQTVPVPPSIRAEGVPPLPAAIARALVRYQNIRSASFQDWDDAHPRALYITTRFGDVPQAHHLRAPGSARRQLTFQPERVLGLAARPRSRHFLFSSDEGGAENFQFFLQDRDGGDPRRITDGNSRNLAPAWSPTGDLLAWSSNARNGRDMDLYVAAPADPNFQRRFKEVSGQWTVSDWSPDGSRVVALEYLSINESYLHIIDVATGKVTPLTPRPAAAGAEPVAAVSPRWSPDGKAIYYLSDRESEFRRLIRRDLETGKEAVLTEGISWDVEGFELSDDGVWIVAVVNQEGVDVLRVLQGHRVPADSAVGLPRALVGVLSATEPVDSGQLPPPLAGLEPGQIAGLKFRRGSHEVGFTHSSARTTGDVYTLNLDNGQLERWTESETGGLDTSAFALPQLIRYPSFDGRSIPAFVYRPPAGRFPAPRPVLIEIHGGPEAQFRPGFLGRLNVLIQELGLVLIMPNVRGSAGYGKSYLKLDNGMLREGAVQDIGGLLDWIATQDDLDPARVGVSGGSYGGFMSLAVQTTYNDRIRAGIDVVGISNFVTFLKNTQEYRRDLRRAEYGDERDPAMREFLERISPLAKADRIKTPILVVQGQNDPRVPISESDQLVAAVRRNQVPVWYVVGTNEGHGFARKVNQDYLQAVEVEFLRRYLLSEERPDGEGS
jgi:dipeptidyl aminopeptidase/acylaminoacyl peptidase